MTRENLQAKYGAAFHDNREMTFGVEFPDGQKSVLRLLEPARYQQFTRMLTDIIDIFEKMQYPIFQELDENGEPTGDVFEGENVSPAPKPLWERDEAGAIKLDDKGNKIHVKDADGNLMFNAITTVRIKMGEHEIKEFPIERIKQLDRKPSEILVSFESMLWLRTSEILKVLFPDDKERFTREYVDKYINVPFMKTLLALVFDMNGLGFLRPFLMVVSPTLGMLLSDWGMGKQMG